MSKLFGLHRKVLLQLLSHSDIKINFPLLLFSKSFLQNRILFDKIENVTEIGENAVTIAYRPKKAVSLLNFYLYYDLALSTCDFSYFLLLCFIQQSFSNTFTTEMSLWHW